MALALAGLGRFSPFVQHLGGRSHLTILLPGIGLFLTTIWLSLTGIGEVSLFKDMDLARKNPYQVFPFLVSIGKVVACTLTIGFGGSAGVEGPCKWFGAALGLQYHRLLRGASRHVGPLRRLARPPLVMVRGGAAAALAAVFRAPISGALMAAEHDGRLDAAFDGWLGLGQTGYLTMVGASALAGATHGTLLVPVVFLAEPTGQAVLVVPALIGTTVSYLVARQRGPAQAGKVVSSKAEP